jgi:hypothetical protein
MRRFGARLWFGWLVVALALLVVPAAQARVSASGGDAVVARAGASSARTVASDDAVRTSVRKAFVAINAANKKLYACNWKHCAKAASGLRKTARHWLPILRQKKAKTTAVAKGLTTAKTALGYWAKTGLDAVRADAAARLKDQTQFNRWYKLYVAHYKLGLKFQNRAVSILSAT